MEFLRTGYHVVKLSHVVTKPVDDVTIDVLRRKIWGQLWAVK